MEGPAQPLRSHVRSFTLLGGFTAFIAALVLLTISLAAFLAIAAMILAVTNFAFLREFGIRTFTGTATLIAFNLLVADVVAIIALAALSPQNSTIGYLLPTIPVLAIAYALMQAFFVREHW